MGHVIAAGVGTACALLGGYFAVLRMFMKEWQK